MRKLTFFANNQLIEVNVENTANKNMYMKIKDNQIVVLVPKRIPDLVVKEFVAMHYEKFTRHIESSKSKVYISFEQKFFFLFGKKRFFEIIGGFSEVKVVKKGNKYFIQANSGSEIETLEAVKILCKQELIKYLDKKLSDSEKLLSLKKHAFKVSSKTRAWGTNYISKGLITFSETLSHYPKNVIDYVVFHELCHDVFADHSGNF